MNNVFYFLESHWKGVVVLVLILFSLLIVINWLARIFCWGKYKTKERLNIKQQDTLSYVVGMFFVNLINDFKHLLALVIVIVFAALIIYTMTTTNVFDQKMEALQLVVASLGGLLGSIIGYYFGESAATKSQTKTIDKTTSVSTDQPPSGEEMKPAGDNVGKVKK